MLHIPASGLFFANAGGKGYYRSAYQPAQYAELMAHVESGLTPVERISVTGDVWAQVHANKATVIDYLNLVAALKSDPDAEVLAEAANGISAIDDRVASTQEERDAIGAWIRHNFEPEYEKLGAPAAGDTPNTRQLRAGLLSLLGYLGNDDDVVAQARKIADEYVADPDSVDPTLGVAALGVAAENGDAELFDKLQKIYETSANPAERTLTLRLLVGFKDKSLLNRGLEYSVSSKVRNQDTALELGIALQIPENRDQAWSFIKSHWSQVQAQLTTSLGGLMVGDTGEFCTAEMRDDVKSFFAVHPVDAADAALRHSIEHIDGCIELRRLQEPNLKAWLAAQDHASK
jgi:aminopeptidase N/puromycin-sensitive aminopeptidase